MKNNQQGILWLHKYGQVLAPNQQFVDQAAESFPDLSSNREFQLSNDNKILKIDVDQNFNFNDIITKDDQYRKILKEITQAADTEMPVLILGEAGTGKELIARTIHKLSSRSDRPILKVNCAALPASRAERTLFGHEKNAFIGAHQSAIGFLELAQHNTILLKEVGALSLNIQEKLLRLLDEGNLQRLGGEEPVSVDVRILATSRQNLEALVDQGKFSKALFDRLSLYQINNKPLRDRPGDIPILVHYFIKKYARKCNKTIEVIPPQLLDQFSQYAFPGNVRELEILIERAVLLARDGRLPTFQIGKYL